MDAAYNGAMSEEKGDTKDVLYHNSSDALEGERKPSKVGGEYRTVDNQQVVVVILYRLSCNSTSHIYMYTYTATYKIIHSLHSVHICPVHWLYSRKQRNWATQRQRNMLKD